jgi:hypothetical protein
VSNRLGKTDGTTTTTADAKAGLNHSPLFEWKMVNPTFRLVEADDPAMSIVGMAGRETLEKATAVLQSDGSGFEPDEAKSLPSGSERREWRQSRSFLPGQWPFRPA